MPARAGSGCSHARPSPACTSAPRGDPGNRRQGLPSNGFGGRPDERRDARRAESGHQPSTVKELPDVHRHGAREAPRPFDAQEPAPAGVGTVLAFAGLSLGLAAAATLGGVPPALVPFVLALGPTVFALLFAWREGDGAVRRLLAMAVRRPNRRAWYAARRAARRLGARVVGVAIALGDPAVGVFDKVFPAIVIVPLIVLIPAFAEEIAWRGYAVTRLLPSMSPLAAALAARRAVGGDPPLPPAARPDERRASTGGRRSSACSATP